MKEIIEKIKLNFNGSPDLKIKEIIHNKVSIIFFESLSSQDKINKFVLDYFINKKIIQISKIPSGIINEINYKDIENNLFNGFSILVYKKTIYAIDTKNDFGRSITTPEVEPSLKGPKDSLVENYETNLGLLKKRLKTKKLIIKENTIGIDSKTKIGIIYHDDYKDKKLLENTINVLNKITEKAITSSSDIEKYLSSNSIFPSILSTERPDRIENMILEGKIIILIDNCPEALILPVNIYDFINPFTDIYLKKISRVFAKILRMSAFILSALIPSFYIAIINYNQEALPTNLIINFASQRSIIPFPAVVECLIMLAVCEVLRESDLRFPSKYGSAISILGALVLGDAAVSAGLVSPIMIIIASFTYISSLIFTNPEMANALRITRLIILIVTSILGLYGLLISSLYFLIYVIDSYYKENLFYKGNKI